MCVCNNGIPVSVSAPGQSLTDLKSFSFISSVSCQTAAQFSWVDKLMKQLKRFTNKRTNSNNNNCNGIQSDVKINLSI